MATCPTSAGESYRAPLRRSILKPSHSQLPLVVGSGLPGATQDAGGCAADAGADPNGGRRENSAAERSTECTRRGEQVGAPVPTIHGLAGQVRRHPRSPRREERSHGPEDASITLGSGSGTRGNAELCRRSGDGHRAHRIPCNRCSSRSDGRTFEKTRTSSVYSAPREAGAPATWSLPCT